MVPLLGARAASWKSSYSSVRPIPSMVTASAAVMYCPACIPGRMHAHMLVGSSLLVLAQSVNSQRAYWRWHAWWM